VSTSAAGIIVPFVCGFVLGQFLPESMLPRVDQRLITSLFLGTALSIASVKIVAMVVREMNFMRRKLGMTLIASAIIDDTVAWTIIAITSSLALHGVVSASSLAQSVVGTGLFLLASFTRRMSAGRELSIPVPSRAHWCAVAQATRRRSDHPRHRHAVNNLNG
jgi:Kef-type K+ transport system membrane component KefB